MTHIFLIVTVETVLWGVFPKSDYYRSDSSKTLTNRIKTKNCRGISTSVNKEIFVQSANFRFVLFLVWKIKPNLMKTSRWNEKETERNVNIARKGLINHRKRNHITALSLLIVFSILWLNSSSTSDFIVIVTVLAVGHQSDNKCLSLYVSYVSFCLLCIVVGHLIPKSKWVSSASQLREIGISQQNQIMSMGNAIQKPSDNRTPQNYAI